MPEQYSQDTAPDHDTIVATYSPEMLAARDVLELTVEALRQQVGADDALSQLSPRIGYHTYQDGTVAIDLGRLSTDPMEALAQSHTEREFEALTDSPDSTRNLTVVTIRPDTVTKSDDPALPVLEEPRLKIQTSKKIGQDTTLTTTSIYPDGYVEASSETVRTELVHPADASDLVKEFAQPKLKQEVTVVPAETKPATLPDITAATANLQSTAAQFGITL